MRSCKGAAALLFASLLVLFSSAEALAYIGPGAGITMLGALWAVVVAIVVAIGVVISWPLRRYFKGRRAARKPAEAGGSSEASRPAP